MTRYPHTTYLSIILLVLFLSSRAPLLSLQTIEEKRGAICLASNSSQSPLPLSVVNKDLAQLRRQLSERYGHANLYFQQQMDDQDFKQLLQEINEIKHQIEDLETRWHQRHVEELKETYDEGYALWDQEETTLSALIMQYGSSDYLYVIPPEISSIKLHMHSMVAVPRESWNSLLEVVLKESGIGIKQVNPYTRQLYLLKKNVIALDQIITSRAALEQLPPETRIAYIFSPPLERLTGVNQFFERFRNPKTTFNYQVGYKIALVGPQQELNKLLTLYAAIWERDNQKIARVLPLSRLPPDEMEKILAAFFGQPTDRRTVQSRMRKGSGEALLLMPLKQEGSIVLIGPKTLVQKAETIALDIENQIQDPLAMTVYTYTCRHSDPEDLSETLEKVYASLIYSGVRGEPPHPKESPRPSPNMPDEREGKGPLVPPTYGPPPYSSVVEPLTAVAGRLSSQQERSKTTNFVPCPKTGMIVMVVRRDTLGKIKELLRTLDLPKKMIQIEILLFERKTRQQNRIGLNMLKLGSAASNTHETGLTYDNSFSAGLQKGILDFFIFREKPNSFFPAFDLAYNFLLAQENMQINAAPILMTLNQTPAQISLVEEISIDNGAAAIDTSKGTSFQKSFSRAQYGTTIVITPTIHTPLDGEGRHFITLETNITFDTLSQVTLNDRPPVSKRHIENYVRVLDGETVILGGLREKTMQDMNNKIPFLGEIPGLGQFFGSSNMLDEKNEMFIFITPRIIFDHSDDFKQARHRELIKRPGDLPAFLKRVEEAKQLEKNRLFSQSWNLFFGGNRDR